MILGKANRGGKAILALRLMADEVLQLWARGEYVCETSSIVLVQGDDEILLQTMLRKRRLEIDTRKRV